MNRLFSLVGILFVGIFQSISLSATVTVDWTSFEPRSAVGQLNGAAITAATSEASVFDGFFEDRFAGGSWQADMSLDGVVNSIAVGNANAGDTQTFVFTEPTSNVLFYIENFDSNSVAELTIEGAGELSLLESSPSVSFQSTSALSGNLTTSNSSSNGEGDAVLALGADVRSVSLDYSGGDGSNAVFYTFAIAVAEPTSWIGLLMGGLLLQFVGRRRTRVSDPS